MSSLTPFQAACLVFLIATATIAGAWLFQAAGYLPCDLCLKERYAYYLGVPLAAVVIGLAASERAPGATRVGFLLLALVFLAGAGFGAYHAGVEWKFWKGPADCTNLSGGLDGNDLLGQLNRIRVVPCDAAAFRIFGVSLAGWNAIVSLALVVISFMGMRRGRPDRSRPHQA